MKKTLAIILAGSLLLGSLCSCGKQSDSQKDSISSSASERAYSVTITSDDVDGPTSLPISYEYVDGENSVEIYYISFGCDIDGLVFERIDMEFNTVETLYNVNSMKYGECVKFTTNTPEGFPNTRVVVTCGENEYRYLLAYNGRDGGANLIDENDLMQ